MKNFIFCAVSLHSHHTKRSIVYSQVQKVSPICLFNIDTIDIEVEKVEFLGTAKKNMKGIPLVITYYPLPKDFASVNRQHLYILYLNKQVKEIFTPGATVSFRRKRKLGSYLVRANFYPIESQLDCLNVMVNGVKFV